VGRPPVRSSKRRFSAFTLVELLVVIAILGILIGIGYQAMGTSKSSAQTEQIKVNLDMLNKAFKRTRIVYDNPDTTPNVTWTKEDAYAWYVDNGILQPGPTNILTFVALTGDTNDPWKPWVMDTNSPYNINP
jgi:prepilin-type N-terminal cleavage/methylation domain-containing protein